MNSNLDDLLDDGFEEYRDFMYENHDMIISNRNYFVKDKFFSTAFKIERVKELIDFFELEEEYERCAELEKIKDALEVQHLFTEIYEKKEIPG